MTQYTISSGETAELGGPSANGHDYLVRVKGADITVATDVDFVSDGTLLEDQDRALISVPPDEIVYAHNQGSVDVDVGIYDQGLNGFEAGQSMRVQLLPRRVVDTAITNEVDVDISDRDGRDLGDVDVTDRTGRNVGKARLMDDSETLISSGNPFPVRQSDTGILTDSTASSGSGSAAQIDTGGGRTNISIMVSASGGPMAVTVEVSADGSTWYADTSLFSSDVSDGESEAEHIAIGARYVRAYGDANFGEVEVSGKGV